ncbi:MAG TPA: 4Fe-4S binding protein [Blastocatellia bacterium]|nr:4Fe-4S binding protein [Blastocatellia bacterium]
MSASAHGRKRTLTAIVKRLLLYDLLKGLAVTFRYNVRALYEKREGGNPNQAIYTEQYPLERPRVSERFRGAPRLNLDPDTGMTLCVACDLCALACPVDCIEVGSIRREVREGEKVNKKKVLTTFIFDTSRCMFCNLCSEACPTDCLELTQSFELAVYHRSGFRWDREMLEKGINYVRYKR